MKLIKNLTKTVKGKTGNNIKYYQIISESNQNTTRTDNNRRKTGTDNNRRKTRADNYRRNKTRGYNTSS